MKPEWLGDMLAADAADLIEAIGRVTNGVVDRDGRVMLSPGDLGVLGARAEMVSRRVTAWTSTG